MASTRSAVRSAAPAVTRTPARATKRRKPTRPPQPRIPEDFFDSTAYALLTDLLASRAKHWKADSMPPLFFYRGESEPLWGDAAGMRCSGTTLRIARQRIIYECLCMDLERGLRLLTLPWTEQRTTTDGHRLDEWRAALSGVLWRIGQTYRELTRRKGVAQAQEALRLAIDTLWW